MTDLVSHINNTLTGYTNVMGVSISHSESALGYRLSLTLANSDDASILLECDDVSNLAIRDFRGGLTQFLCLRASDVREMQHDRVAIHFADLEENAISFDCSHASVKKQQV
jgi:hypothetical protein